MEYTDYDDYEQYEPENIEGLEDSIKINSSIDIDAGRMRNYIKDYVSASVNKDLKRMIKQEVALCIKSSYKSKARFDLALKEIMREKFNEVYPDVVENKINELEKKLKDFNIDWSRETDCWKQSNSRNYSPTTIKQAAKKRVDDYVENELAESVKLSKEYIEQFAKNYFAKNLFRAMGMMDSMIPQAKVGVEND